MKNLILFLCATTVLGGAESSINSGPNVLPIREKYLLLDSRVVEGAENAVLRVGTVTKNPANPLFGQDLPWELDLGHMYLNVVFDPAEQLYQLWYCSKYSPLQQGQADWAKEITPAPPSPMTPLPPELKEAGQTRLATLYATSKDGLHWEKPALDVYHYRGKPTNIVFLEGHGVGVFRDAGDSDPHRRYKMITSAWNTTGRIHVAFSSNGTSWSELKDTRISLAGDTHNNAFWDPVSERYVAFTRGWSKGAMGMNLPTSWTKAKFVGGVRTVMRVESDDFIHWTPPVEVMRGPASAQVYSMPVFRYAGVYLGLPAIFHVGSDERVQTELAWSPDTKIWHRIDETTALIPFAENRGSPDWGCIYAASSPVVLKDEIRIYYAGEPGPHAWNPGYLCLATLRPDGWAGYTPSDESRPGVIATQFVTCSAQTLRLTADVSPGGSVKVSVWDTAGHKLAPNGTITRNVTNGAVVDLTAHQGAAVRIRFELDRAKVYSFAFAP